MTPDLQKLRRFALAIGLVLLTYSLAIAETPERIPLPLFPEIKVDKNWLPIGLMLASAYALASFLYYGTMLTESPGRTRRPYRRYDPQDPYRADEGGRDALVERIQTAFPKVYGSKVTVSITTVDDRYEVEGILIPWRVNVAARLEEINYLAPIWVNGIALALAGWQLLAG